MSGREEDQSLVDACRAGDKEAFGTLVRRYQDRLYPTVLRLTGRPENALDLLQDAFLRAYRKLNQFHGESSFYTWLYRLTVNLALSDRRRRKPIGRSFEESENHTIEPVDDSSQTDPTLPLERLELEQQVQQALDSLAPDHRAVVVLKDVDGLQYEDIAKALGIPVGTVRSRLHRARSELRRKLESLVGVGPP